MTVRWRRELAYNDGKWVPGAKSTLSPHGAWTASCHAPHCKAFAYLDGMPKRRKCQAACILLGGSALISDLANNVPRQLITCVGVLKSSKYRATLNLVPRLAGRYGTISTGKPHRRGPSADGSWFARVSAWGKIFLVYRNLKWAVGSVSGRAELPRLTFREPHNVRPSWPKTRLIACAIVFKWCNAPHFIARMNEPN